MSEDKIVHIFDQLKLKQPSVLGAAIKNYPLNPSNKLNLSTKFEDKNIYYISPKFSNFLVNESASPQPEHEVQRRLLLNVVVRERSAVLQLLARENQPLLIRRNALLVLDLLFHVLD